MTVDFSKERWDRVKENASLWWDCKLGRPLIQVRLKSRDAGRVKPNIDFYPFTSFYPDKVSAAQIVDCWEYSLSETVFLGDAFPCVFPNFGPGVIAGFLGAGLANGTDTVWFHPEENVEIKHLDLKYDAANKWLCRVKDIVKAADEKFSGLVQVAMTDLGGNLDILSTFRPSEKLLYDLYDYPDDVKKALWTASDLWLRYFNELGLAAPRNPGYSNWALVFSELPSYILQCDFCYMLGPGMFNEFVLPELKSTAGKLKNTFYHLDGPGQLVHLDTILAVDEIKGIEWVPGAGVADVTHWPDVYKKISDAGKKIHIFGQQAQNPYEVLDVIEKQTGRVDNVVYIIEDEITNYKKIEQLLNKYVGK
jgi:5-methyltetrahydrofolate--homocysteine methyltransferase